MARGRMMGGGGMGGGGHPGGRVGMFDAAWLLAQPFALAHLVIKHPNVVFRILLSTLVMSPIIVGYTAFDAPNTPIYAHPLLDLLILVMAGWCASATGYMNDPRTAPATPRLSEAELVEKFYEVNGIPRPAVMPERVTVVPRGQR